MEDDQLKTLFSDFAPEISSDFRFMSNLRRSINSVELIKKSIADIQTKNKKALAIAAVVSFIFGFLFSQTLPYLSEAVYYWQETLPDNSIMNSFADNFYIIIWFVIGITSALTALNTYEISLFLMKTKINC